MIIRLRTLIFFLYFQDKEEEITLLAARNIEMKGIVEELESEIKKFKSALDSMIKKSKIQHVQDDSIIKNDKKQQVQEDSTKKSKSLATTSKSNTSEFDPADLSFLDDLQYK